MFDPFVRTTTAAAMMLSMALVARPVLARSDPEAALFQRCTGPARPRVQSAA